MLKAALDMTLDDMELVAQLVMAESPAARRFRHTLAALAG
jgi:hypothetical protein